jgi:nucleoid-associated protein
MAKNKNENLEIKNFVIHQLLKDAGTRVVKSKQAKKLITINEKEKTFLNNLDKSYHKKSSPIYGIFANERPNFKNDLISYSNNEFTFYDFSISVMNYYKEILENTPAATGGYMILCEYTNKSTLKDLLLVLMINNKEGYVVNEIDLTLDDIKNLDLNRVDVACLINLTEWKNIEEELETDRQTYLSFVKGMKQVSYYFMTFVDVDNKKTSTESTNNLIKAFDEYSTEKKWDRDTKIKKRNQIFEYSHECMATKNEILLKRISTILDPENPNDFENFSTEEGRKVSSVISGDKSKMKVFKYLTYSDESLKIEFDSALLLNETIHYDKVLNKLTIKNLPQELVDKINDLN